jgi:hypothetical protein
VSNANLVKRRDSKSATGRAPAIPKKVRTAVEIMSVTPGAPDYTVIAKAVGYRNAYALRRALALPQSVRWMRQYKREVLEQINLHNPEALRKVRDTSENGMAVTAAVRQLEVMGERMDETTSGRNPQAAPGVVIVIEHPGGRQETIGPRPPVIKARPDEFGPVDKL